MFKIYYNKIELPRTTSIKIQRK